MKKYLLFGMLTAILAGALVLAGCEGATTPSVTNNYTGGPVDNNGLGDKDTLYEQALPSDGFVVVSTVDEAELALNISPTFSGAGTITSVVLAGDNDLTRRLTIPSGKALYVGYAAQGKQAGKLTVKETGSIVLENGNSVGGTNITGLYAAGLEGSRTGAVILESGATITTGPGVAASVGSSLSNVYLFNKDDPNATFATTGVPAGMKGVTNLVTPSASTIAAYGTKASYDVAPSGAMHIIYSGTENIGAKTAMADLVVVESSVLVGAVATGSIEVLKGGVNINGTTAARINIREGGLLVDGVAVSTGQVNVFKGDVLVRAGTITGLRVYEGGLYINENIEDVRTTVTAVTATVDKKDVEIYAATIGATITATAGNILVEGDIAGSLIAGGNVVLCNGSVTGGASGAKILVNGGDAGHTTFFVTNPTVTKGISLAGGSTEPARVLNSVITANPTGNIATIATTQSANTGSIRVGAPSKVGAIELTAGTYQTATAAVTLTGGDTSSIMLADTAALTLTGAGASIKAGNTTLKSSASPAVFIDVTGTDTTITGAGEVSIGGNLSLDANAVLQTILKDDTAATGPATATVPRGLTTPELAKVIGTGTVLLTNKISTQTYGGNDADRVGAITTGGGGITLSVPQGVTVVPGNTIAMSGNKLKVVNFVFGGTLTATAGNTLITGTKITTTAAGDAAADLTVSTGTAKLEAPGVTFTAPVLKTGDKTGNTVTVTATPNDNTVVDIVSTGATTGGTVVAGSTLTLGATSTITAGKYTFSLGSYQTHASANTPGGGVTAGAAPTVIARGSGFKIEGPATIGLNVTANGTLDITSGTVALTETVTVGATGHAIVPAAAGATITGAGGFESTAVGAKLTVGGNAYFTNSAIVTGANIQTAAVDLQGTKAIIGTGKTLADGSNTGDVAFNPAVTGLTGVSVIAGATGDISGLSATTNATGATLKVDAADLKVAIGGTLITADNAKPIVFTGVGLAKNNLAFVYGDFTATTGTN